MAISIIPMIVKTTIRVIMIIDYLPTLDTADVAEFDMPAKETRPPACNEDGDHHAEYDYEYDDKDDHDDTDNENHHPLMRTR